jgi:hypothetical protein
VVALCVANPNVLRALGFGKEIRPLPWVVPLQHHWQHWNVTCPLVGQHHMVKGGCKLPSRVAEWGLGIPTVQPYSCTRHTNTNIARRGRFIFF